jgi:uncharacterized protein (TIGR00299 family) protein
VGALRALIFDPFAGISGDMTLGALIDLGLDAEWLRAFVASLEFQSVDVRIERAVRRGISCGRVHFVLPHEHAHRHLRHVLAIIDAMKVSDAVKARASDAFRRLAEAEAKVHATTAENVHFHEVGALDAILDITCVMAGIHALGFESFFSRPVAVGHGWVEIEHGRFPVPAPATLELLQGFQVTGFELAGECTTPTGAAILAVLTGGKAPPDSVTVTATGFGAGSRDPADRPNCVRLIAVDLSDAASELFLVQTDIDDLSPEYFPPAQDAILAAGALDVVLSHLAMKKGRPGVRIEALVPGHLLDAVLEALFVNTSTLGVRYWPVRRPALQRREETVEWRGQRIRRKRVRLPGGGERAKPEYEDVVRAAKELGLTPLEVRSALEGGLPPTDGPGV